MSNSVFPMNPALQSQPVALAPVVTNSTAPAEFDFVGLAWRYRGWLACGVLVGGLVGHLLYQKLGPEYAGTAKVLVSKLGNVQVREGHQSGSGDRGQHVSLIMSPLIVERAVKIGQLDRLPSMAKSKDVVEDIVSSLKVQRTAGDEGSVLNVLDITYKSSNRAESKVVVDAIIAAYDEFLKESHQESMTELVRLVDKANVSLRTQIEDAERKYQAFRATAPIHLKQPLRGPHGERLPVAANVHQDNLLALEKERQTLLLRKAELQSQIQSFDTAIASGRPREELAASIQLLVPGSHHATNETGTLLSPSLDQGHPEGRDAQWLALKLQEEKLLLEYGPEWPEIQALRRQLAIIEQHYRIKGMKLPFEPAPVSTSTLAVPGMPLQVQSNKVDLVAAYTFSLRQQLDALMRREAEIERVYNAEYEHAQKLARFVEQDRRYNEDLDRLNGMWGVVRGQAAQIDLLKDNVTYSLKQISPVRDQLSIKRLIKLYGAGVASVLGLVAAAILLREKTRSGQRPSLPNEFASNVEVAQSVSTTTSAPVGIDSRRQTLAVRERREEANSVAAKSTLEASRSNTEKSAPSAANAKPANSPARRTGYAPPFDVLGSVPEFGLLPMSASSDDESSILSELRILNQPESVESSAFREVTSKLLEQGNGLKQVIAVISPEVGDGKTTLTSNLAVALAQDGKRVLVIDGDVLSPGLHTQFGLRNEIGLAEVVAREVDLLTAARQTLVPGLSVLTSGSPSVAGQEIAAWDVRPLIDEARREFDIVLIDTPSMMSSTFGSSITRLANGAVFVWRPEQSAPEFLRRATEILNSNGSPVIGAITNRLAVGIPVEAGV